MAKLNRGIKGLAEIMAEDGSQISFVNLTNIASLEIFQIRSFLIGSLNHFRQLALPPSTLARLAGEQASSSAPSRLGNRLGRALPLPTAATGAAASEGGDTPMPVSTRKIRRIH